MSSKYQSIIIFCFLLVILIFLSSSQRIQAYQSNEILQIAFASDRDGNYEIYIMDADGNNLRRLTENSSSDRFPAWSPDGTQIAFLSDRDGSQAVYVMNADGSDPYKLVDEPSDNTFPVWSPDGSQIAFRSDSFIDVINGITDTLAYHEQSKNIFVASADGSNVTSLIEDLVSESLWLPIAGPVWSPDGQYIAFYVEAVPGRGRTWNSEQADGSLVQTQVGIYITNPDGGDRQLLADEAAVNIPGIAGHYDNYFRPRYLGSLAFSPNSGQILFAATFQTGNGTYIIDIADAQSSRFLLLEDIFPLDATWSPDGQTIAYTNPETHELWLINADGTNNRQLYDDANEPKWSPDGVQILFSSAHDILVINADGSNLQILTDSTSDDIHAVWRPQGQ